MALGLRIDQIQMNNCHNSNVSVSESLAQDSVLLHVTNEKQEQLTSNE